MRYLIVLTIIFLNVNFLLSQNSAAGDLIPNEFDFLLYAQEMANKPGKRLYLTHLNDYSNIDGSPFWFKDEVIAEVVQIDGDIVTNVPIIFDQFKREILAKSKNGQIILLEEAMYHEIQITRGTVVDIFRKVHPAHPMRFYQVLYENDEVVIFKDVDVRLNESASSYIGLNDKIREFRRKTTYHSLKDREVKAISFKKKNFYDSFNKDEEKWLKKYVKDKKLKLKNEEDFVKVLVYLYQADGQ